MWSHYFYFPFYSPCADSSHMKYGTSVIHSENGADHLPAIWPSSFHMKCHAHSSLAWNMVCLVCHISHLDVHAYNGDMDSSVSHMLISAFDFPTSNVEFSVLHIFSFIHMTKDLWSGKWVLLLISHMENRRQNMYENIWSINISDINFECNLDAGNMQLSIFQVGTSYHR